MVLLNTYSNRMKRLEFGSQPVIQKTIVRSDFSLADWTSFAMLTRFFVFPFRQGSTPSKPDIVVFSWKLEGDFRPVITVAATDEGLMNPKLKITCKSLESHMIPYILFEEL